MEGEPNRRRRRWQQVVFGSAKEAAVEEAGGGGTASDGGMCAELDGACINNFVHSIIDKGMILFHYRQLNGRFT